MTVSLQTHRLTPYSPQNWNCFYFNYFPVFPSESWFKLWKKKKKSKSDSSLSKEISRNLLFAMNAYTALFFLSSSCHSLADQSLAYEKNSAPNGRSPKEKMFLTRHDYEWRTCCASVRLMACVALKRTSVSFA